MLIFKQIEKDDYKAFQIIAEWENQDDIKYMIRPNMKVGEIEPVNASDMQNSYIKNDSKYMFFFYNKKQPNTPIGYVDADFDFGDLYGEKKNAAWIGICIGDANNRHKGYSKIAIDYISNFSRDKGCNRLELGVFDYNLSAIKAYEKTGFKRVGTNINFVYYKNEWHDDIRMEKKL